MVVSPTIADVRVAWDMQAVTGPKPTGLGVAAAMLQDAVEQCAPDIEIVPLRPNLRNKPLKGVLDRLGWEQVRLPRAIEKSAELGGASVFFSPALGVPLRSALPKVAYVHDLIPLKYPRQFGGAAGWYWKELLPMGWRSCDALVVSNGTVADDLRRMLGYPLERIHVAPYPLDPEFAELAKRIESAKDEAAYFVCLGTLEGRKNIEQSILALMLLSGQPQYADVQLRLIGMPSSHEADLRGMAADLHLADRVKFLTDYIPREEVVRHLLGATALLFMSRYEGFGLPPLEAMSIGCPVVLSATPVHRAVYDDPARRSAGDPQPLFVRLDDLEGLAAAMRRLLADNGLRAAQAAAGLAYSATFTMQATADGLRHAFEAAAHR